MPWNFPFWQVFRFAAPALMAGNVGLLKHASNVPQCALAIEDIFRRAGFPEGVFQTLLIGSNDVRPRHRGSARRRRSPSPAASRGARRRRPRRARRIKKTVLELGGSDPFIVMPSADLDAAIAHRGEGAHHQQRPVAASPPSASSSHEAVADEFERAVRGRNGGARGRRSDGGETDDRPAGHRGTAAHDRRAGASARSAAGARVLTGGRRPRAARASTTPDRAGGRSRPSRPAFREELFGPVGAALPRPRRRGGHRARQRYRRSAWAPASGPGATRTRERFVDEIESGMVFVNAMVASDPRLPFGGVKRVRLRARAESARHPRVREREDGLGGVTQRTPIWQGPDYRVSRYLPVTRGRAGQSPGTPEATCT